MTETKFETFTITVVSVTDIIKALGRKLGDSFSEALSETDRVSFGNNADTLVSLDDIEYLLDEVVENLSDGQEATDKAGKLASRVMKALRKLPEGTLVSLGN